MKDVVLLQRLRSLLESSAEQAEGATAAAQLVAELAKAGMYSMHINTWNSKSCGCY